MVAVLGGMWHAYTHCESSEWQLSYELDLENLLGGNVACAHRYNDHNGWHVTCTDTVTVLEGIYHCRYHESFG